METPYQLEERRAQAASDLADVDEQLASGELDPATAAKLTARYEEELRSLETKEIPVGDTPPPSGRSLVGTSLVIAAIIGIVFLVARAIDDRGPGEFITGSIDSGRDVSEVSNAELEQVVIENPNVVGMRLALARRYFQAQLFSEALPHYFNVLDQDPDNAEALANLGWMTYLTDPNESATAEAYLERSLSAAPTYGDALFYLANVRLYGLNDRAGARELLEVLAVEDMPDEVAELIGEMLTETGS